MSPATPLLDLDLDLDRPTGAAQPRPLVVEVPAEGWEQDAACLGSVSVNDPADDGGFDDPFFGPENEPGRAVPAREARAKQICAGCPVREPCGLFALATGQRHGVWGGLGESDRRLLLERGGVRLSRYKPRSAAGGSS